MHPFYRPARGHGPGAHEKRGGLEEDGWLTGSGSDGDRSWLELELEDERANPKYGIMAVRSYLEKAHFPADTTIELAGMESPIYG